MAGIYFNEDIIKNKVKPPLNYSIKDLDSSIGIISSINIPSDFAYYSMLKNFPNNIGDIKQKINDISRWLDEKVAEFQEAENKNNRIINELITNSLTHVNISNNVTNTEVGTENVIKIIDDITKSVFSDAYITDMSFLKGLGQFGESIVDSGAIYGTICINNKVAEVVTNKITWSTIGGLLNQFGTLGFMIEALMGSILVSTIMETVWKITMGVVAEEHVDNYFDNFFQNNLIGQLINENAHNPFKYEQIVSQVSTGLGYMSGQVLTGYIAGGTTIATSCVSAISGLGKYTQEHWAKSRDSSWEGIERMYENGEITEEQMNSFVMIRNLNEEQWKSIEEDFAYGNISEEEFNLIKQIYELPEDWKTMENCVKGLVFGSANGLWDGLQMYVGAKLGSWHMEGSSLGTSFVRITADTTFNALDTPFRTLVEAATTDETIGEAWKSQGGWQSVFESISIGLIGSTIGEIIDFDFDSKNNLGDIEINKNSLSEIEINKNAFDADISANTNAKFNNTYNQVTKLDTDINRFLEKYSQLVKQADINNIDASNLSYRALTQMNGKTITQFEKYNDYIQGQKLTQYLNTSNNYDLQFQGNAFLHIKSKGYRMPSDSDMRRIYINCDGGNVSELARAILSMNEGRNFYMKMTTDSATIRGEKMVIYCDVTELDYNLKVLQKIREYNPNLFKGTENTLPFLQSIDNMVSVAGQPASNIYIDIQGKAKKIAQSTNTFLAEILNESYVKTVKEIAAIDSNISYLLNDKMANWEIWCMKNYPYINKYYHDYLIQGMKNKMSILSKQNNIYIDGITNTNNSVINDNLKVSTTRIANEENTIQNYLKERYNSFFSGKRKIYIDEKKLNEALNNIVVCEDLNKLAKVYKQLRGKEMPNGWAAFNDGVVSYMTRQSPLEFYTHEINHSLGNVWKENGIIRQSYRGINEAFTDSIAVKIAGTSYSSGYTPIAEALDDINNILESIGYKDLDLQAYFLGDAELYKGLVDSIAGKGFYDELARYMNVRGRNSQCE